MFDRRQFLELLGVSGTTGLLTVPTVEQQPPEVVIDEYFWSRPQVLGHWIQKFQSPPLEPSLERFVGIFRIDPTVFSLRGGSEWGHYAGDVVVSIECFQYMSPTGVSWCEEKECRCHKPVQRNHISLLALTEKSVKLSPEERPAVYPYKCCERCKQERPANDQRIISFYHGDKRLRRENSSEVIDRQGMFLCGKCHQLGTA